MTLSLIAAPNLGLGTWPARRARITPERTALLDERRSLTYADLADRTARYAGALRRLGVGGGDRVASLGVSAVEVFETFFATWLLGAIAVPLNYRLSGAEIRYMLEDSAASVLVHSGDANAIVAAAVPLPGTVRHALAVDPADRPVDGAEYEAEVAAGPTLDSEPQVSLDDPAILLYTSGTTGRPKGAVLTHGNLTWNTVNYLAHVDVLSTDRALGIAPLFHCYGMTEASPGVYMSTHDGTAVHPTAVGVPHFFTDVALLRDGRPAPVGGEPAELGVRGPHVFAGYWNRPEDTAAGFVDDQWFRTGDVLSVDDDGWARVVDRVKDMYISGGENVYPAEVEAVAVQLDAVANCAVVGLADSRWGEVGVAYVQLREGATLTEAELRAHLEAHLARYKVPKYVEFVPELPRNATGKIRRVELRHRAVEDHPTAGGHGAAEADPNEQAASRRPEGESLPAPPG